MQLHLEISAFNEIFGLRFRATGAIRALRGGRTSDYAIELFDTQGRPFASAQLLEYARLAESYEALVARCLHLALTVAKPQEPIRYRLATLGVRLGSEFMFELHSRPSRPSRDDDGVNRLEHLHDENVGRLWQGIAWEAASYAFGAIDIPQLPPFLEPPVRYHAGISYCRLSDLPADARRL